MSRHEHRNPAWEARGKARAVPLIDEQLDSRDLFATARVLTIVHGSNTYQLRLTAQDKLILTK